MNWSFELGCQGSHDITARRWDRGLQDCGRRRQEQWGRCAQGRGSTLRGPNSLVCFMVIKCLYFKHSLYFLSHLRCPIPQTLSPCCLPNATLFSFLPAKLHSPAHWATAGSVNPAGLLNLPVHHPLFSCAQEEPEDGDCLVCCRIYPQPVAQRAQRQAKSINCPLA